MSNLVTRTISGAVFVSIVVASILLHPIAFGVVFFLICGMTLWEFYSIVDNNKYNQRWGTVSGMILFITCFLWGYMQLNYGLLWVYAIYIICALISELFRKQPDPIHNWAYLLLGQVMVAIPMSSLCYIMFCGDSPTESVFATPQTLILLSLFVIIWTNDTGAYCVGSLLGKHKMFPRVSPGKSWEGLVGGFVFALVAGWIFSMFVSLSPDRTTNIVLWLGYAALVSVFGTLGDLMESLTKRTLGIKDSGNIIPGHGGMLDRFDSMLLAAPVIAMYLMFIF